MNEFICPFIRSLPVHTECYYYCSYRGINMCWCFLCARRRANCVSRTTSLTPQDHLSLPVCAENGTCNGEVLRGKLIMRGEAGHGVILSPHFFPFSFPCSVFCLLRPLAMSILNSLICLKSNHLCPSFLASVIPRETLQKLLRPRDG